MRLDRYSLLMAMAADQTRRGELTAKDSENWRDITQSKLTLDNNPPHELTLLLQNKQFTLSNVLFHFCCCSAQREQQNSRVILQQQHRDDEGQVAKESFFQLCEGSLEQCRVEMQGVDMFLKIVLFHGQTNVSLGLLQDLIKPYGPVDMETLIEVVVRWDMDGSLEHEHFQQYVKHGKKLLRGKTLLKCAIEKGRTRLTKKMLSISEGSDHLTECACTESELDEENNNLFHLAARAGKKDNMTTVIKHRQTAEKLLRMTSESTKSPSKMTRALSRGVSFDYEDSVVLLNQYNLLGNTPLALATNEGHFAIVLSLLLVGANPNVGNLTTGYTPLHLAATMGYANIVKALLIFGADMTAKDRHGKTAVDRAGDYPEVAKCFAALADAVETGKTASSPKTAHSQEIKNAGPFLLCMDGGGTRGLATCILLREIEDRIRKSDSNFVTLASYFDYVTGTSIGAFVAFSIAYRQLAMTDIIKLCFEFKDAILSHRRPYPEDKVNDTLQSLFTEDTLMSAVRQPKVMAITCKADTSPPSLHVMRNTGEGRNGEKGPDELKVWEAARATSAAPTYFPPYGKFLDGGILANNPTVSCIAEVIEDLVAEEREPRLGMVVSVGTGSSPPSEIKPIHIPRINSPKDLLAGAVGVMNFLILMLDQMTYAGGSEVTRSRAWCTSMKSPFFRLDPNLSEQVDLGETDEEKLVDLMFEALLCAKRESQQLDAIADVLLSRPPRDLKHAHTNGK